MKRTLSLVLALVMVLGSFSAVFAAPVTTLTAGEFLQEVGVLTGNQNGDLKLEDDLKRRDSVVLISRLMDQEEEAKVFPSEDLKFDDITDSFYNGFVAWAVSNGIVNGKSETKFDPNGDLEARDFATMLLRVLGHEPVWAEALETAKELGLLEALEVEAETTLTRGMMAVMTFNTLGTAMKDSTETLADKLSIEMPAPEVSTDIEITAAKAVANNKVEVTVKEEVTASVADFVIVKKGSTTEVEVKDVVKESATKFVLETEALTAGTSYTVKSNGKAINFTGIAADKTAPTVTKLSASDTNRFQVTFSDVMDKATAENLENYTFDKDLNVVKATLSSSRKVVTLETDAAKKNVTYKVTIEGLTNNDGVAMKKFSQNVRAIEYTTAPIISGTPKVISSTLVEVTFVQGTYGMNKASLETVENYTIEGLEVTEAKAYDKDEDAAGLYEVVLLTTEEQDVNKSYKLTVAGVTDNSVLKNVIKSKTFTFRGMRADKTAPAVASAKSASNNEVDITFSETSAMGIASMTDPSNYKITYRDGSETLELSILEAEAWADEYPDAYDNNYKGVTLTTEEQIKGKAYVIEISNVEDEYGNAMKATRKLTFLGEEEDVAPPTVKSVKNTDKGVVVEFDDKSSLNAAIVKDPTNYIINGGVGTAVSTSYKASTKTVTLTTGALTANKTYNLTIENIEDRYGNLMPARTVSFVAIASSLDTTAPSFSYAYAENSEEVHISFDEAIEVAPSSITMVEDSLVLTKVGTVNDKTTVVYSVAANAMNDKTYTFPTATDFKDAAGNKVDIKEKTFIGVKSITNDAPEVDYVEQTNVKTIVLSFTEPVNFTNTAVTINYSGGSTAGTASRVDTSSINSHEIEWKVVLDGNGKFNHDIKYTVVLNNVIDLGGKGLVSPATKEFTADYHDDVKPSIVGVTATSESTVIVEYDEELNQGGTYQIYYVNASGGKVIANVTGSPVSNAKNKVTISYPTKGSEIYYLTTKTGAMDYAGNRETIESIEWDFLGSDVKATGSYVSGVKIINAKEISVNANFNIVAAKVYEVDGDVETLVGSAAIVSPATPKTSITVTPTVALLDGVTYKVVATNNANSTDYTFEFKGVTPNLGLTLESGKVMSYDVEVLPADYDIAITDVAGTDMSGSITLGNTYYVTLSKDGTVLYSAKVDAE